MDKKDLARFQSFLKNEPVLAVLNRNLSFLLDEGKRIQSIEINDKMESYTDGKRVVISGIPSMITPEYDRRAWILMMRIALAHEVQHDNSSDFKLLKNIQVWFAGYMKKNYNIREEISTQIAQSFLNCMEDGRIDEIVVQRFPGYLGMMRMVNFAIRGEDPLKKAATDPGNELCDFQNQILSYSITGLNLPGITVYHGKRMEAEFMKIRPFIDQGVASPTAKGCYDACKKVLETSAPYIASLVQTASNIMDALEKLLKENYSQSSDSRDEETGENASNNGNGSGGMTVRIHPNQQSSGKNKKGSSGDSGKDEKSQNKNESGSGSGKDKKDSKGKEDDSGTQSGNSSQQEKGNGIGQSGNSSQDGKGSASDSKSQGKKASQSGQNDQRSASERAKEINSKSLDDVMGSGFSEEQSPPATEEELQDMLNAAADELQRTAAMIASHHVEKGSKTPLSRDDIASLQERYGSSMPALDEKFVIPTQKPVSPVIIAQSKRLHEKLATILMKRRIAGSGHRRGYIDPNKLWKVGVGDENIFKRKDPPKLSDCAVYELIDGSGSMSDMAYRQNNTYVNKLISALTTASIMEEALKGLASTKVTIFRAGFGGHVEHTVIKDFGQKPYGSRCFDAMGVVSPSNGNMDGFSIRIAAMDLAKRPEKNKILLVLSDGLPSAYHSNKAAMDDVRSAAKWARMHGITVISIMFGEENFLKSNYASYKAMYEQDIIAVKPVNINREFELLLAKLIK